MSDEPRVRLASCLCPPECTISEYPYLRCEPEEGLGLLFHPSRWSRRFAASAATAASTASAATAGTTAAASAASAAAAGTAAAAASAASAAAAAAGTTAAAAASAGASAAAGATTAAASATTRRIRVARRVVRINGICGVDIRVCVGIRIGICIGIGVCVCVCIEYNSGIRIRDIFRDKPAVQLKAIKKELAIEAILYIAYTLPIGPLKG